MNPFEELKPTPLSEILLDKAFRKSLKASYNPGRVKDKLEFLKRESLIKVKVFGKVLTDSLNAIVKNFPSLGSVDPFYYELIDVLFGVEKVKQALSSINGTPPIIRRIIEDEAEGLKELESKTEVINFKKRVYGRVSSLIKKISPSLKLIREIIIEARNFPSIDKSSFTIVVAGQPNVGKSTFVKAVSTAQPEIADYPFTTKRILVGHLDYKGNVIQVIDTPGLLDREPDLRNKIELQSIIALKHLADLIIYLFDPTETCGYSLTSQLNLFKYIKNLFPDKPVIPVINKIDLAAPERVNLIFNELGSAATLSSVRNFEAKKFLNNVLDELNFQRS
ncbi:MAG: 50S ribosome-binding GTPase [Candidatus Odinarchaeum yellowstonii]|uniref:50S ribosome-binding GTPase n=1 Tax=Odinarchaeota yellowstonii (strain LCB_4) TaxID=1841599 RepID=A0AAF0D1C6_ODILC|nr:MAG: 50S ribosome-binding GTPase [Candidatus Odinarchaeum yellowstonii]